MRYFRPGGRITEFNGYIYRYAQDGETDYGSLVRVFQIDILTTVNYMEHEISESPILKAGENG